MAIKQLAQDLYIIRGLVNVYVLETADGLAVLDTGFPNSAPKILDGVRALGRRPDDVRHILLTHAHPDHIGSAAALKRETGATVWAHPIDAPIIEAGTGFRHVEASPGLRNRILTRLLLGLVTTVEPTKVDQFIEDGDSPPFLPDLIAIHAPGHCAGQIAFLLAAAWRRALYRRHLRKPVRPETPGRDRGHRPRTQESGEALQARLRDDLRYAWSPDHIWWRHDFPANLVRPVSDRRKVNRWFAYQRY